MRLKFSFSILMLCAFLFSSAQTLKSWNWDYYKMKFQAPDNMVVQESNSEKFEATNTSITMDIYPRVGENLTYDGMKNAIVNWATSLSMYYTGSDQPIYLSDINRYWGCAIDGSKSGFPASILLLVDPDHPSVSFYIWISYKQEYYHDAVAILKSFQPM
jgi:hypothetical protein